MKYNKKRTIKQRSTIYKYTIKDANLMQNKSMDAKILTVIPKDSKIEVIDSEEEWFEVIYNSKKGYIYKEFLSKTKYTWANLNLRKEKFIKSEIISVIPKKSRVEVLEKDKDWSKIIYDDNTGYVFNYYLSDDGNRPGDLNYTNFYNDINKFISDNNIKSPTNYLIITDLSNIYTYIFEKDNDNWKMIYKWKCTIGKPSTPTIEGVFGISGRKPSFGTDRYMVKYATRIKGGYYYHSILYDSTGSYVIDDSLGVAISHGCIRLDTPNAKWIYENIPDKTTVIIH